jgi:hypothetical protein
MLGAAMACSAYDGVARLFAEESGDLFNSLSFSARYQMLNNYYSNEKSEVFNNLQTTESRILNISNDDMLIATSSGKTVELKLLPVGKNDTVIVVIETVATPIKDSQLSFYDLKWKRLDDSRFITKPQMQDFIQQQAPKEKRQEIMNLVHFAMIEMAFEGNTLVARCNLQDFYMGDDFKHYSQWVNSRITYVLNKGKLKRR